MENHTNKFRIDSSRKNFILGFREVFQNRELLSSLILRDVKLRYKQTILGIFWVVLQPLLTSVIFSIVFGRLGNLPSEDIPYELFALAGLLPWILIKESIQRSGTSMVREKNLIRKIYFPRLIIPFASAASALVDFLIALIANVIIFMLFQVYPSSNYLFLPILMIPTLLISYGVGFIIAPLNAYYRDFAYTLPFGLQTWLFISPIAYSSTLIPENWKFLYDYNPVVGIIDAFRWMLLNGDVFPTDSFVKSFLIGIFIFLVGTIIFNKMEVEIVDVI